MNSRYVQLSPMSTSTGAITSGARALMSGIRRGVGVGGGVGRDTSTPGSGRVRRGGRLKAPAPADVWTAAGVACPPDSMRSTVRPSSMGAPSPIASGCSAG